MKGIDSITIIGIGRFGETLIRMFGSENLRIFDIDSDKLKIYQNDYKIEVLDSFEKVFDVQEGKNLLIYAVPISKFEIVIDESLQYLDPKKHLLMDVLSVKEHPAKVFKNKLNPKTKYLLSHPMFGPDSSKNGFNGLKMVIDDEYFDGEVNRSLKGYFQSIGIDLVQMSASEHDKLAANSQGVAHFIGRVLDEFGMKRTPIDTTGASILNDLVQLTANDTWELFNDLQTKNHHTKGMRLKLGDVYDSLYNKLLPKQINPNKLIVGIQGGVGSFNEQAVRNYALRNNFTVEDYQIVYLHTSEGVLSALHSGDIDQGQFAMHNSVGGIVEESVHAMSNYKFEIMEEFAIKISHHLMIRKDVTQNDLKEVLAHPQVLKQCKETISKRYPEMLFRSGQGNLIDHANVAKALMEGKLDKNIGVMGPSVLANLYDLKIIDRDLQDSDENWTSFLMVRRG